MVNIEVFCVWWHRALALKVDSVRAKQREKASERYARVVLELSTLLNRELLRIHHHGLRLSWS